LQEILIGLAEKGAGYWQANWLPLWFTEDLRGRPFLNAVSGHAHYPIIGVVFAAKRHMQRSLGTLNDCTGRREWQVQ
jgi:hypothetical protein